MFLEDSFRSYLFVQPIENLSSIFINHLFNQFILCSATYSTYTSSSCVCRMQTFPWKHVYSDIQDIQDSASLVLQDIRAVDNFFPTPLQDVCTNIGEHTYYPPVVMGLTKADGNVAVVERGRMEHNGIMCNSHYTVN